MTEVWSSRGQAGSVEHDYLQLQYNPGNITAQGPWALIDDPPRESASEVEAQSANDAGIPWSDRADELADWVQDTLLIRTDRYGRYKASGRAYTASSLTRDNILGHFRAGTATDVIGLHPSVATEEQDPDGEPMVVTHSRWACIDIDHHGPGVAPDRNFRAAEAWHDRAAGLGFSPILIDSDGRGGFKLFILFNEPIRAELAYHLIRWLQVDWAALGFDKPPETFPKQKSLTLKDKGSCGNWVRLFGRHHKRPHYTRVWGASEWLEGDEAIDFLIGHRGDDPRPIPAEVHELARRPLERRDGPKGVKPRDSKVPARAHEVRQRGGRPSTGTPKDSNDVSLVASALRHIMPAADDYDSWIKVGMSLRGLGDLGLSLWDNWSRASPKYKPGECCQKWSSFSPADELSNGLGLGTLFKWATAAGWRREIGDVDTKVASPIQDVKSGSESRKSGRRLKGKSKILPFSSEQSPGLTSGVAHALSPGIATSQGRRPRKPTAASPRSSKGRSALQPRPADDRTKKIEGWLRRLPRKPEYVEKYLYMLARRLRSVFTIEDTAEMKPIVRRWYDAAAENLARHGNGGKKARAILPWGTVWADYIAMFMGVKIPHGADLIRLVVESEGDTFTLGSRYTQLNPVVRFFRAHRRLWESKQWDKHIPADGSGPVALEEVSEVLGMKSGNLHGVIKALEKRGLVREVREGKQHTKGNRGLVGIYIWIGEMP